MIGAGALRREQQEHDVDRSRRPRRRNRPARASRAKTPTMRFRPDKLAVRDGDALAEPSRAEPLALEQRVEDIAFLKPGELAPRAPTVPEEAASWS